MPELLVDLIISLDGYASADGWPGWWGLEGPEYLAWLGEQPPYLTLMGATTYRVMSGLSAEAAATGLSADEAESLGGMDAMQKVVFSSSVGEPLAWPNTEVVTGDAVEWVAAQKRDGDQDMSTLGSLSLTRSLLVAGLVDRFRLVVFPVITGRTGSERIYDGYPDVALELVESRTFDGRSQLLEYVPTVLPEGTTRHPAGRATD